MPSWIWFVDDQSAKTLIWLLHWYYCFAHIFVRNPPNFMFPLKIGCFCWLGLLPNWSPILFPICRGSKYPRCRIFLQSRSLLKIAVQLNPFEPFWTISNHFTQVWNAFVEGLVVHSYNVIARKREVLRKRRGIGFTECTHYSGQCKAILLHLKCVISVLQEIVKVFQL